MAINRYFSGLTPSRLRDVKFFQPNVELLQQTLEKKQTAYDEFDFMSRVTPPFRDADTEAVQAWQGKMGALRDQVTDAYAKGEIAHGDRIMRSALMEVQKGFQPGGLPYSISERKRMEEEFSKSVDASKLPFDHKQTYKKRMAQQVSPLDLSSEMFTPGFEPPTVPDAIDVPTYFMNFAGKVMSNLHKSNTIEWKEGVGWVHTVDNSKRVTEDEIVDAMLDLAASDKHLDAYSRFVIENDAYTSGITDPNDLETYIADRKLFRDPKNNSLNELNPFVNAIRGAAKTYSFEETEKGEKPISSKSTDTTKTSPNGQEHNNAGGHAWITKTQPAVPRSGTTIMPSANFNDDNSTIIKIDENTGLPDVTNENAEVFIKNNMDILKEYSKSTNLFQLLENNELYGSGELEIKPNLQPGQIQLVDPLFSFDIDGSETIPTLTERINFGDYIPNGTNEDMNIKEMLSSLEWENPDGTLASSEDIEKNVEAVIDIADTHIRRINELAHSIRYVNKKSKEEFAATQTSTNKELFLGENDDSYDRDWYDRKGIRIDYELLDDYSNELKKLTPSERKKYSPPEKHLDAGASLDYIGTREKEIDAVNDIKERILRKVSRLQEENPDKKITFNDVNTEYYYSAKEGIRQEAKLMTEEEIRFLNRMTGTDIATLGNYEESMIENIIGSTVDENKKKIDEMKKNRGSDIDDFLEDYATIKRDKLKRQYTKEKAVHSKEAISDLFSTGHDILYVYSSLGTQGVTPTDGWTKNASPVQQEEAVMRKTVEAENLNNTKSLSGLYIKPANSADFKSGKYGKYGNVGNITDDHRGKGMWVPENDSNVVGIKHGGLVVDGQGKVWAFGNLQYKKGSDKDATLQSNGPMVFYHRGTDDERNLTQKFYNELGFDGNHMPFANFVKSSLDNKSDPDNENFGIFTDMNMIDNHIVTIKRGSPPGSGTTVYRVSVKDEEGNVKLSGDFDNHIDLAFNLRPFVQKSKMKNVSNPGNFVGTHSPGFISKVRQGSIMQLSDNQLLTSAGNNWSFKHKNPETRYVDKKFWDSFSGFANNLTTKFPSGITITSMARSISHNKMLRSPSDSGHAIGEGLDFRATDKRQASILLQAIKQMVPDFEISSDDSSVVHYPIPNTNLKIAYHKGTGWHFDVKFQ